MKTSIDIAGASTDEDQASLRDQEGRRRETPQAMGVPDDGRRPSEGAWPPSQYAAATGRETWPAIFTQRIVGESALTDRARAIVWDVALRHNVSPSLIIQHCRNKRVVAARIEVAKLLYSSRYSLPRIGTMLKHDHTTIFFYLGKGKKKPRIGPAPTGWHRPRISFLHRARWLPPEGEPDRKRRPRRRRPKDRIRRPPKVGPRLIPYAGCDE